MENNLKITSLHDLQEYAKGQIVELPPFGEGQPFVARLGRPSLLELVKNGNIPNSLLTTANELFVNGKMNEEKEELLGEVFGVMDALAEATFLEPTYKEIKDAGVTLTDEQMMFVFSYTQKGVAALRPFRKEPRNNDAARGGAEVFKAPL